MTAVSLAIMAHPSRAAYVAELQAKVGPVPVAWAEPPFVTSHHDRSAVYRTFRTALLMHDDAPFHCVIQDDAVPCRGFRARLERLVEAGDYLYMLFWRPKRAYMAEYREASRSLRRGHFVKQDGSMLGVGMAYPTDRIPDLIAYADALPPNLSDDQRVKLWHDDRGLSTYVPLPSLVDHRGDDSLVWHGGRRRTAWKFAG